MRNGLLGGFLRRSDAEMSDNASSCARLRLNLQLTSQRLDSFAHAYQPVLDLTRVQSLPDLTNAG